MNNDIRNLTRLLPALALLLASATPASAAFISRTIVIDGNMGDWYDDGSTGDAGTYTPAGNITTNTNQFSTDCIGNVAYNGTTGCDRDALVQSTGRDLQLFSFTYDSNNIYMYVQRYASLSNATDWWFYLDTDADGYLETGEFALHVKWTGSNRNTNVEICPYTPSGNYSPGDPMVTPALIQPGNTPPVSPQAVGVGDGWDMPGTVPSSMNNCPDIYATTGGANTGTEMEVSVPWSSLGMTQPGNIGFHIASSNGTNLPGQLDDNMDGTGGGQLFPSDLSVNKSASVAAIQANGTYTYTITAKNEGYVTLTDILIDDILPALNNYQSHTASTGSFVDTNANSIPDQWQVTSLISQASATLTITVKANNPPVTTNITNTATLVSLTGTNFYTTNDSGAATVQITPAPELTVTKVSSAANASTGDVLRYTVNIANNSSQVATQVVAIDDLSGFTAFRLDTFGPGDHVRFTDGGTPSGLVGGTPQFSDDDGMTWGYSPTSGGGGAPAGFDADVTDVLIPMTGTMNANGASFSLEYDVRIR